jgi:hypothetical protein
VKILWLKTELLHPIDKGGKIRTYQMLKELKKNHHITYLTLDDGSAEATRSKNQANTRTKRSRFRIARRQNFRRNFILNWRTIWFSKLPYAYAEIRFGGNAGRT